MASKSYSLFDHFQNLRVSAQRLIGFTLSTSVLSSLGLHLLVLALILCSGYLNLADKVSQPPIDVDLVDIEFTTLDQDLSRLKVIPKKSVKSEPTNKKSELSKTELKPALITEPKSEISQAAKQELESLSKIRPDNLQTKPVLGDQSVGNSQAIRISYDQYLVSYINKYKTYPRIAERLKQQGVVVSKIVISKDGQLKDVIINKSSGFSTLDQGTVNLIKSLAPFKPLPDHFKTEYEVSIPIEYILGS